MQKSNVQDTRKRSIKDIEKEIVLLREEMARMKLDLATNPQKDTNLLMKKKKRLAVLLTVVHEKKEEEAYA